MHTGRYPVSRQAEAAAICKPSPILHRQIPGLVWSLIVLANWVLMPPHRSKNSVSTCWPIRRDTGWWFFDADGPENVVVAE